MSANPGTKAVRVTKKTYDRMTAMIARSDPKTSYRAIAESALVKYLDRAESAPIRVVDEDSEDGKKGRAEAC